MDAIAGKVIERLTSLALDEFVLIWNLKDDLERMENTVSAIKAKLLDAEAKASNHQISDWLRKLKDVLLDADDMLDDISTEALIRSKVMTGNKMAKEVKRFFSTSNQMDYCLNLVHKMKEIRKRLDDIDNDKNKLQLSDLPMATPIVDREERQTLSGVHIDGVIGREEEKNRVLSYLLDNNVTDEVSIITIVGLGGLGKTALAQLVYNDEAVQNHFDSKMWVCVSEEFSVKQIAQKILGGTTAGEIEQMQRDIRNKIRGKKFLLVLDDVWNEDRELWLQLKSLLTEGAKGSVIIVTTRSERAAKIMHTHNTLSLKLGSLDADKSWQLFSRVAFEGGKEPNDPELVTIGKDIVKKCVGVPLAIRTIGSLLYCQRLTVDADDPLYWSYFKNTELSKIDHEDNKIFAILRLSYNHLGSNLKNCFAYCSLFPKDFEIKRETLIQLWIAQGFIPSSNQTRPLEDVGGEYFMKLLSRGFFQDVTRDGYGDIYTCKMHDLMHELAMDVSENECVVISERRENIVHRLRHVSFDFELEAGWQPPTFLFRQKKLRTFMLPFGAKDGYEDNPFAVTPRCKPVLDEFPLSSLTSTLECLRVLDVQHTRVVTIPKSIGKLKHLRYLDLSRNRVMNKLPESVTELINLQTLKLSGCGMLKELPRGINKLVSLRHLELDDCWSLRWMPHGLGQLTCLQTLTRFALDHGTTGSARISELSGLSNLRGRCEIVGLETLPDNIAELESTKMFFERQCFRELVLRWRDKEDTGSGLDMILQGIQLRNTIKRLTIFLYICKSLPDSIGNLSSLQEIQICDCSSLTSLPDSFGNLSSLQGIQIHDCSSLTSLPDSFGNLSSLQWIQIHDCSSLTSLPDSIGNLSSLQGIQILDCSCLTSLPDSFGNLLSLQWFQIHDCSSLTSLPNSFGNLSSLQWFQIYGCSSLTLLPDSFGNLSSLQWFQIHDCSSLTLLPDFFENLSSLQWFQIHDIVTVVSNS